MVQFTENGTSVNDVWFDVNVALLQTTRLQEIRESLEMKWYIL